MAGFAALTVYKIDKPDAVTADGLKKYGFRNAPGEEKAWGWTSIDDLTDAEWLRSVPEKGGYMAFSLRVDTRKVPGPVLKLHLEEAFQEEQAKNAAEGKAFISRARKKELKELHASKLISKAEPVPATVDVAIDKDSGLVFVGSTSSSMLDLLAEYIEKSFGAKLEAWGCPDTPDQACRVLRRIYDSSQTLDFDGHPFTVRMSDSEKVSLAGVVEGETSALSSTAASQSVDAALADGMQIVKLHIQMDNDDAPEDGISFTWSSTCAFSGLKTPGKPASEDDDPDAVFLEKMYLLGRVVGVMADLLAQESEG